MTVTNCSVFSVEGRTKEYTQREMEKIQNTLEKHLQKQEIVDKTPCL